ncbi:hypothetical protein PM10SUCC1_20040 [Propionigenium maris DSM 9537]|uniref:ADP-heptose:LPS heptosyltransferase n=1 Tax=Propionigenium maris DSM 9537 TaxID=1123000 RepID=A0A9W6GM63_9FUSO|nr:glycosyltransferase family 9 protein [Propionigenium maris]GLI56490.1 hypothetical protein PM10SUCC1_20040 [Propionigenium maris DSM 9537]
MVKKIRKNIGKTISNKLIRLWILLLDRRNKINVKKLSEKKVLIADCEKIGNYIFKTPLIRGLKKSGFHVTVMGSHITKELLEADPYIDDAIITRCYRKKSSDIFRKAAVALKYRGYFSHYIETTGSVYLRELLFMRLLSPMTIIGTERKRDYQLKAMNISVPREDHNIDTSISILNSMGIREQREYHIGRMPSAKYSSFKTEKPLILYNGRASVESRSIDPAVERELTSTLEEIPYINFRRIEKEDSLHDLVDLIDRSALVITVDTGISHIASALKKGVLINNYNRSVAPVTPNLLECSFTPEAVSTILKSIFSPAQPAAA